MFLIPDQKDDFYLEAKEHLFPFKFQLPRILPNSFEHPYGRTRYQCLATLDIPWYSNILNIRRCKYFKYSLNFRAIDKHANRSLTILNKFDLNQFQNYLRPIGVSDQKVVCCGPCTNDPISLKFHLKKSQIYKL